MDRLKSQVAIVTGGGTGIGQGIALALVGEGARVVVCGRRKAPLDKIVQSIWKAGGGALAVQGDVSKEADVGKIVQEALATYGQVDILVNNAGIYKGSPFHALETASWDENMAVNLRGPFLMTRAIIPYFRAQRRGHIINISSESGLDYYPDETAYGTSKHALNAFGEFVQRENQELGIKVNTICPGMVVSEMSANEPGLNRDKCLYPEDIADLVLWLVTRRPNSKIGTPILIQTMENPWE